MPERVFKSFSHYAKSGFFQLLVYLILLFFFRPSDKGMVYIGLWQLIFTGVFFASVFNCQHTVHTKALSICFGIPALILNWVAIFYPLTWIIALFLACTTIFIAICAVSILARVILHAKVTLETLRGAICVYFMFGFAFAFCFYFIDIVYPASFHIDGNTFAGYSHTHYMSEMFYFSFVTLLTIGFGDIVPAREVAQTFTILEGIIGQFYIAILVARLVSVYALFNKKQELPER